MTHMYVEFDGLQVWGRGSASPHDLQGFGIKRNGLDQFEGTAARTGDVARRDVGHGDYWSGSTLGGITRTLEGVAWARSHDEVERMHDQLMRLNASEEYRQLLFRSEKGPRYAMARVEGRIDWTHDRWVRPPRADFSIAFHCADPWWNGEERFVTVPPRVPMFIENRGAMPAWPFIEVQGPIDAGWGTGLGTARLWVNRAVAAGETVTVDHETGAIVSSIAGPITGQISGYESFVPAVSRRTFNFAADGAGSARVRIIDRYL